MSDKAIARANKLLATVAVFLRYLPGMSDTSQFFTGYEAGYTYLSRNPFCSRIRNADTLRRCNVTHR